MLDERSFSARCLVTFGLWAVCLTVWVTSWLLDSDDLGRLSIIVCGIAATVHVKGMFIEQHRRFRNTLAAKPSARGSLTPL